MSNPTYYKPSGYTPGGDDMSEEFYMYRKTGPGSPTLARHGNMHFCTRGNAEDMLAAALKENAGLLHYGNPEVREKFLAELIDRIEIQTAEIHPPGSCENMRLILDPAPESDLDNADIQSQVIRHKRPVQTDTFPTSHEDSREVTSVDAKLYNKALNMLLDADPPTVTYLKDGQLEMANEAIENLFDKMRDMARLLKSANDLAMKQERG